MRVTSDVKSEVHSHSREVIVEDAPIIEVPNSHYSHKGKSFQPRRLVTSWDHGKEPTFISVHGLLLKQDGSVGNTHINIGYRLTTEKHFYAATEDALDWMKDLIK